MKPEITPDSIREYNEFGTWIVEIDENSMIPRIFRDDYRETNKPEILIKIPRILERRLASPGMDLYDYLIGAFDAYLYILKRNGKNVEEKRITYEEIRAIQKEHSLLKGEITIFSKNDVTKVRYNTVSDEIIARLIAIIQKKKTNSRLDKLQFENMAVEYAPNQPGSMDLYLINITNKVLNLDPEMGLVAYQTQISVGKKPKELSKRIRHLIKFQRKKLNKGSFLSDGRELVMINCDITKRNKSVDGYTYFTTYLLIQDITDIRIVNCDTPMVKKMELDVQSHTFEFMFEENNRRVWDLADKIKFQRR